MFPDSRHLYVVREGLPCREVEALVVEGSWLGC
jgi:hypothetical protein